MTAQPAAATHPGPGTGQDGRCPPAGGVHGGATGAPPVVAGASVSVTGTTTDDPSPTVGSPTRIKLSGEWDPDGDIFYYCARQLLPVTERAPYAHDFDNFLHTYTLPGAYTMKWWVVDREGHESADVQRSFYVNSPPTAGYTYSPAALVAGQPVTFRSTSSDAGDTNGSGGVARQEWDLDGDGRFDAEGASVTWVYATPGTRTVLLQVTDGAGSKRRVSKTVAVDPAPVVPEALPTTEPVAPPVPCARTARGTARRDVLVGTVGGDRLLGRGGDDILSGVSGDDCLIGAWGADALSGGAGKDRVSGGAGDDRLSGGAGDDILVGGGGTNRYVAGSGDDTISSANGRRETVSCGSGRDVVRADSLDRLRSCERVVRAG